MVSLSAKVRFVPKMDSLLGVIPTMKLLKGIVCAFLGMGAIASSLQPAAAVKYGTDSVYKATENSITTVYVDGTAGTKVAVDLGQMTHKSSKIAGACGQVSISVPKGNMTFTGLKVDGTAIDYSTLPTQTLPSCTSNGTFAESRTANFKTARGQVVIVGKTVGTSVSIEVPAESVRNLTINGCGTGMLHAVKGETLPATFKINGTSYTLASLPDSGHGPVCKKAADGTYSAYTPSTWPK